jgi:hypothetical protein
MAERRKLALITGASAGIGVAFARLAARRGCDVALAARRLDRLEALADELRAAHNIEAMAISADLCEPCSVDTIFKRIGPRGVDILVNNAGYSLPNAFAHTGLDDQLRFLELMVSTPIAATHRALPHMLKMGWGRIINISSITAFSSGGKGHTLYPAAKSFLVKFSQSLNAEVSERGVNVTAVTPGFVDTEFQIANKMAEKTPKPPRFMLQTPEQIAEESWRRNESGVEVVVPGLLPKVMAAFLKYAPEQIVTPITRKAAAEHYIGE